MGDGPERVRMRFRPPSYEEKTGFFMRGGEEDGRESGFGRQGSFPLKKRTRGGLGPQGKRNKGGPAGGGGKILLVVRLNVDLRNRGSSRGEYQFLKRGATGS